jgi:hypothetical protein
MPVFGILLAFLHQENLTGLSGFRIKTTLKGLLFNTYLFCAFLFLLYFIIFVSKIIIMKLLRTLPVFLFFIGVLGMKGQNKTPTDGARANPSPALKAEAEKNKTQVLSRRTKTNPEATASKSPIDANDEYMGRRQEFLGNLTVKEIPGDFPKYKTEYSLSYYNQLVDNYYLTHKDVVQPWVTKKLNH